MTAAKRVTEARVEIRCAMLVAGLFGTVGVVALVIADWLYFNRLAPPANRYGCGVARLVDRLPSSPTALDLHSFDQHGMLKLGHGIARLSPEEHHIVLRPHYHSFSIRVRTAWPMKATIHLQPTESGTHVEGVKRIPWSSALLTLAWLITVAVGTMGFVIAFLMHEGFSSLGGVLLGIGVTALGLIVLAFGLVIIALAYRLENQRLTQTYAELRQALLMASSPSS
ncbi:MAG: hypothetical protein H0W13_05470 [Nitrospirales bacterium]|nr:hypothetical protein [Nitrospirales bacterium]